MNLRPFAVVSWIVIATCPIEIGLAETPSIPQPDRHGNYFRNETSVQGKVPASLSPGSLWQVVSVKLNCRHKPGMEYDIVRQFQRGDLLQADIGRGGSDEVLLNAKDRYGKPWMFVRSALGESYSCFVRANRRYIQPYTNQQLGTSK
jgi:hypothetical protein